jgi:uncharacterized membrane protein
MLRDSLKDHMIGMNPDFRHRGVIAGRMENFSDAVFALAITLLLISTSPPSNFDQIKRFVWELIPFSLCIIFIILIWHEHFTFFFRYGLRNSKVLVLNSLFLILVLFYVYPLKFLTKLILFPIAMLFGQENLVQEMMGMIRGEDMADLMIIYGLGAFCVFGILMLMYRYALKNADALELNEIERFDTKAKITTNKLMAVVPLISVVIAIIFHSHWVGGMLAGFTYFLYTPVMFIFSGRNDKARKALLASIENKEALPPA